MRPVVLGAGAPASVVGIAAALSVGDADGATRLRASSEALGFPVQWGGRRRYAGGFLPVGDAFLAWSSTRPLDSVAPGVPPRPWRLRWILASLGLVALGGLGSARLARRRPGESRVPES